MSDKMAKLNDYFSDMKKDFEHNIQKVTIHEPKTPNTSESPSEYFYDKLQVLEGAFFNKVNPTDAWREHELTRLQKALEEARSELILAYESIFGRSAENTLLHEFDPLIEEINFTRKNHKYWIKENLDSTFLIRNAKSFQLNEPYGLVLIVGDSQSPLLSTIRPLIGALASGNHVVVYGDSNVGKINELLANVFKKHLDEKKVMYLDSKIPLEKVLEEKFDFIYATGSENTCKLIAKHAGEKFTPFTCNKHNLNVAIVDETANLNDAVEKIVYSKFLNNGHFPTVPDHIYVHEKIYDDFLIKTKIFLYVFYGQNLTANRDYGKVMSNESAEAIIKAFKGKYSSSFETKLVYHKDKRVLEPLIISNIDQDSDLLKKELRAPVIALRKFSEIDGIYDELTSRNVGNVYYFTKNTKRRYTAIEKLKNSNVYINNSGIQHLNPYQSLAAFGPYSNNLVGGKPGFKTFSRSRVIVDNGNLQFFKSILPPFTTEKYNKLNKFNYLTRVTNRTVKNISIALGLIVGYQYFK